MAKKGLYAWAVREAAWDVLPWLGQARANCREWESGCGVWSLTSTDVRVACACDILLGYTEPLGLSMSQSRSCAQHSSNVNMSWE